MTSNSHTQYSLWLEPEVVRSEAPVEPPAPLARADVALAVREVLSFCPRLLSSLPAASTLVCACARPGHAAPFAGGPVGLIVITTSAHVYAAVSATWPTFAGTELAAMALAAEHERASPAALGEWCDRKAAAGPSWRLTAADALGPVAGRFPARGYTIGRVLEWYGVQLIDVAVGDELPAALGAAAGGDAHA